MLVIKLKTYLLIFISRKYRQTTVDARGRSVTINLQLIAHPVADMRAYRAIGGHFCQSLHARMPIHVLVAHDIQAVYCSVRIYSCWIAKCVGDCVTFMQYSCFYTMVRPKLNVEWVDCLKNGIRKRYGVKRALQSHDAKLGQRLFVAFHFPITADYHQARVRRKVDGAAKFSVLIMSVIADCLNQSEIFNLRETVCDGGRIL